MRKILIIAFILSVLNGFGQVNIDSLTQKYSEVNDTASINKLLERAASFNQKDYETCLALYKIAAKKAMFINNKKQMGKSYIGIASAYVRLSNAVDASLYYKKAMVIAEQINDKRILSQSFLGLGSMYLNNDEGKKALIYFKKALFYCKDKDYKLKATILGNIAMIYYNLSQTEDSTVLGQTRYDPTLLKKGISYSLKAFKINKEQNFTAKFIVQCNNLCLQYIDLKKLDSATYYLNLSEIEIKKTKLPVSLVIYNHYKGRLLRAKGEFTNAIKAYETSIQYAKKVHMPQFIYEGYVALSETYEYIGDYKNAMKFMNLYVNLKDKELSKENFAAAADLQNKYENEKKEKKIIELRAKNEKKATLNKILIGASIALLFIGFLGYRNFRNKQKLQNLKINQLEKDKQLLAIDAMLRGQEEERGRIAKDLHDGLGGLLSGTKLSFTNMKENLLLTPENATQFDKSLNMLDTTIADLRKVAHNLMPEALVKFGLNDALRDFCSSIQQASAITVEYQKMGIDRKIGNTAETFIYRIIQELVNNAVKHANAKEIMVQLTVENNKVLLTVEDDGKGYNQNQTAKGDGLGNIAYRVHYFKGKIDTATSPNNGTSVNIELNA